MRRRTRWEDLAGQLDVLDQELTRRGRRRRRKSTLDHDALESAVLQYRRVLSDYALARSRFAGTSAERQLAALVQRANHRLRTDEGRSRGGLLTFYRFQFPRLFQAMATEMQLITALFLCAILLGVALAAAGPEAGTAFLGQDAIDALDRGEIWTDKIRDQGSFVSAAIARNNMKVAVTAWAGGLLAGLGSLIVVFFNGMMLGVVAATTAHFDMHGSLLDFISAHGPLELTLILVAGGAGLHLGVAMLREGDESRATRLARAARTSVLVLLGCLPFFLLLGFVEGFLSPSPNLSSGLKLLVGVALWAIFLTVALRSPGRPQTEAGREPDPLDVPS